MDLHSVLVKTLRMEFAMASISPNKNHKQRICKSRAYKSDVQNLNTLTNDGVSNGSRVGVLLGASDSDGVCDLVSLGTLDSNRIGFLLNDGEVDGPGDKRCDEGTALRISDGFKLGSSVEWLGFVEGQEDEVANEGSMLDDTELGVVDGF